MISGNVPPGGSGGPKPPQDPDLPSDKSNQKKKESGEGKSHRFFTTDMYFDSKQWRMFNLQLYQQFKTMMQPLWQKAREALKRLGKDDPYADG